MNLNSNPKPAPELIWREVDDGVVVVSPKVGKVRVLNEVGTAIWQRLADGRTINEIESFLVEQYEISRERAASDLRSFLSDLTERGLLIWDS